MFHSHLFFIIIKIHWIGYVVPDEIVLLVLSLQTSVINNLMQKKGTEMLDDMKYIFLSNMSYDMNLEATPNGRETGPPPPPPPSIRWLTS